jgi:hypothetical protein
MSTTDRAAEARHVCNMFSVLPAPTLNDFSTGRVMRAATAAEIAQSAAAEAVDGIGIILVDGRECYVETAR